MNDDLKDVFRQAAEIAQSVPESMQVTAFNRALDLLTTEGDKGKSRSRPARPSARNPRANTSVAADSSDKIGMKSSRTQKKSTSGLGPKSAITSLLDSGFFVQGKTRSEVQAHLRTTRGYNIGGDQLGVAMLRFVREGVLARTQNDDGQYVFKRRTGT